MRTAFIKGLVDLAEQDERIVLMVGDLGFTVVEPFSERFPDRFYNVGVAEQNLIGLATGLAEAGFIPFVYSIATFASLRGYEFIRNGPLLHHFPVRIIAVGGGFEYGQAGITHHALEDLAVMRALPGLAVLSPADYEQAVATVGYSRELPGPVYFRLGKNEKDRLPGLEGRFSPGRAELVRAGEDALLISTGALAFEALAAAELLEAQGVDVAVAVLASLAPVDVESLAQLLTPYPLVLSVEAHVIHGGLGSLVAEVIAEEGLQSLLMRSGVRQHKPGVTGSEAFMHRLHGLDAASLAHTLITKLEQIG